MTKKELELEQIYRERNAMLVKALRGNEYTQGRGRLINRKNEMCCLGVACDIFIKHNPNEAYWNKKATSTLGLKTEYEIERYEAPYKVSKWFGWDNGNPDLKMSKEFVKKGVEIDNAASCNDTLKMNFKQIANAFERTFVKTEK